jgi:hypothetical protein
MYQDGLQSWDFPRIAKHVVHPRVSMYGLSLEVTISDPGFKITMMLGVSVLQR